MKCPEDTIEMRPARPGERHGGHVCTSCAGTWLDAGTIADLAAARSFDAAALQAELERQQRGATTWPCPRDGVTLRRAEAHGIELDWCPACRGVWFQHEELERVLTRARPGGPGVDIAMPVAADLAIYALLSSLLG
jgi:Zn-finger nucleic acid-binding protein